MMNYIHSQSFPQQKETPQVNNLQLFFRCKLHFTSYHIIIDFDILVANGFYIHQVHFEGNSSDIILTNTSGNAVGIDFNYE